MSLLLLLLLAACSPAALGHMMRPDVAVVRTTAGAFNITLNANNVRGLVSV